MRGVIFFVCLCALLLRGHDYIYTGIRHHPISALPAQHNEKKQQTTFANESQDHPLIKEGGLPEKDEYLICEDVEDEDDNDNFSRKYKSQARNNLTFSRTFILNALYGGFKDRQSFCSPSSYRYIIQRALRI